MNEQEITESNILIAEFMGLIVVPCGTKAIGQIKLPEVSGAFLKYHSSWNELMPVLEKISTLTYKTPWKSEINYRIETDFRHAFQIEGGKFHACEPICLPPIEEQPLITAAFKCAVQFIKHYNAKQAKKKTRSEKNNEGNN